jgi:hypothetical protein
MNFLEEWTANLPQKNAKEQKSFKVGLLVVPAWCLGSLHILNLEFVTAEIDQQAALNLGGFQIAQNLCDVLPRSTTRTAGLLLTSPLLDAQSRTTKRMKRSRPQCNRARSATSRTSLGLRDESE